MLFLCIAYGLKFVINNVLWYCSDFEIINLSVDLLFSQLIVSYHCFSDVEIRKHRICGSSIWGWCTVSILVKSWSWKGWYNSGYHRGQWSVGIWLPSCKNFQQNFDLLEMEVYLSPDLLALFIIEAIAIVLSWFAFVDNRWFLRWIDMAMVKR